MNKIDDATKYSTLKRVEDTCRAMIASYETDKQTYQSSKNSKNLTERGYAVAAIIHANAIAAQYNEFILKNSFIFRNGVPRDISARLPTITEE